MRKAVSFKDSEECQRVMSNRPAAGEQRCLVSLPDPHMTIGNGSFLDCTNPSSAEGLVDFAAIS
jgi:hypothetical protein